MLTELCNERFDLKCVDFVPKRLDKKWKKFQENFGKFYFYLIIGDEMRKCRYSI